jgi:ADP-ribose pyrophosphatase YjhB (NUDIX family)
MTDVAVHSGPPLFALAAVVVAERDGEILLLKRAAGEMVGSWYLPGGAVDAGETVEEAARRELFEESGLVASRPHTCVAGSHFVAYGYEQLQVMYAAECPSGDVVLSHEHSGARWMPAETYRDRYFGDEVIARFEQGDTRVYTMLTSIRAALDAYLDWRRVRAGAAAR